jgi:hypothetical protein
MMCGADRPVNGYNRPMSTAESSREMLRHVVATVAYRAAKAVREAPADFGGFRAGEGSRTAGQILAHMGDLFDWALSIAEGRERWSDSTPQPWAAEVERFFAAVKRFDDHLASPKPLGSSAEKLFQGALADSLTHIGQIGMLRRLAGAPVRGESYFRAEIERGRVGPEQAPPRREFD